MRCVSLDNDPEDSRVRLERLLLVYDRALSL